MQYLFFLIFYTVLLWLILRVISNHIIISFPFWICVAYTFLFFSHLFSPFTFYQDYSLVLLYVLIVLLLLCVGYFIGYNIHCPKFKYIYEISFNKLSGLAFYGTLIYVFDLIRLNTIVLGFRIEDQQISAFGTIGLLFSGFSILCWLKYLIDFIAKKENIGIYAYLSIISYIIPSVITAGRQQLLIFLGSSIIAILWSKKRYNPSLIKKKRAVPILGYVILCLIGVYFIFISLTRSNISNINNKMQMFENAGAKVDDNFVYFANTFFMADILVEGSYYYSHEFPRLAIIYDKYDYPLTYGFNFFPYFYRRIEYLDILASEMDEKQEQCVEGNNFSPNTWGTFITNYIVAFGRVGTCIMALITGCIIGILSSRESNVENEIVNYTIRNILFCVGAIFSVQFIPTAEMNWFMPIVFISFIKLK